MACLCLSPEEHENFASGDGTVTYMFSGKIIPEAILADNQHAKIVFALRCVVVVVVVALVHVVAFLFPNSFFPLTGGEQPT